ncbi:hypothetical protein A0J48_001575 [Sphaerospermopsis aphanizomenoides BCCUSP55]|nr:hypothetical protein [Sphaerospermopsis aphanizomenoides BCCUSP55]
MNNYCPCCSDSLLKHIRRSETYWFCRTCWQEMPVITLNLSSSLPETILAKVPRKIQDADSYPRCSLKR